MKKILYLAAAAAVLMSAPVFAGELQWSRNVEDLTLNQRPIKQYHVYLCKIKGCLASDLGALWVATVPQPPVTEMVVRWPVPVGIDGGATVTAEDIDGKLSLPAVPINFSTVPTLPPVAPLNLQFRP